MHTGNRRQHPAAIGFLNFLNEGQVYQIKKEELYQTLIYYTLN